MRELQGDAFRSLVGRWSSCETPTPPREQSLQRIAAQGGMINVEPPSLRGFGGTNATGRATDDNMARQGLRGFQGPRFRRREESEQSTAPGCSPLKRKEENGILPEGTGRQDKRGDRRTDFLCKAGTGSEPGGWDSRGRGHCFNREEEVRRWQWQASAKVGSLRGRRAEPGLQVEHRRAMP